MDLHYYKDVAENYDLYVDVILEIVFTSTAFQYFSRANRIKTSKISEIYYMN